MISRDDIFTFHFNSVEVKYREVKHAASVSRIVYNVLCHRVGVGIDKASSCQVILLVDGRYCTHVYTLQVNRTEHEWKPVSGVYGKTDQPTGHMR